MNSDRDRVRIDKWLWAARFFKTGALAQAAAAGGKVRATKREKRQLARWRDEA